MEKNIKYFNNYGSIKKDVEEVNSFLNPLRKTGYFIGKNDIKIYYEKYVLENEKGKIVISHGFTEFIGKYEELIYYFLKDGYSVFIMEHRGHGRSGHLGQVDETQVSVKKFDYYIEDFKKFIDEVVKDNTGNMYLYAHSMGGAIACIFLERYKGYFKKAILSAPMFKINTGGVPYKLAEIISKIQIKLGKGGNYVFGQKAFNDKFDLESAATSNEHRYRHYHDKLIVNRKLGRGGASFLWLNEAIKATKYLIDEKNISNIDIPILLFQSGRDTFVDTSAHNKFKKVYKDCDLVRFENGKHELYLENDEILHNYLDKIFDLSLIHI